MDSDSKICPYCAEIIKKDAIKCKHCGEYLKTTPTNQNSLEGSQKNSNPHNTSTRQVDVIYLKDGTVRKGTIIMKIPNVSVKIKTLDGYFFVDDMDKIEKIESVQEENVKQMDAPIKTANEPNYFNKDTTWSFFPRTGWGWIIRIIIFTILALIRYYIKQNGN